MFPTNYLHTRTHSTITVCAIAAVRSFFSRAFFYPETSVPINQTFVNLSLAERQPVSASRCPSRTRHGYTRVFVLCITSQYAGVHTPPAQQDSMTDWPSPRVAQGGLFHTPKARYTKETQDLIKGKAMIRSNCMSGTFSDQSLSSHVCPLVLMEEAKLTILQRNKINYHLRNGEPLPVPKEPKFEQEYSNFLPMAIPRKNIKKRSLNTIIESGAFDVEKYVPHKPKEPIEKLKLKLQEQMSGIKIFPDDGRRRRVVRSKSEGCMDFVPPDRASECKNVEGFRFAFPLAEHVVLVLLQCSRKSTNASSGWKRWRHWARGRSIAPLSSCRLRRSSTNSSDSIGPNRRKTKFNPCIHF